MKLKKMFSRKALLIHIFSALLLVVPALAEAANNAVSGGLSIGGFSLIFGTGLASTRTLPELILAIIQLMLFFAGAIAVLFVIIGGFLYMTAGGNEEQAEKGQKALTNAVIGIIIVIMSYAIIRVVQNTVGAPYVYVGN